MTHITMEHGALDALPALCEQKKSLIMCDSITLDVAAKSIFEQLQPNAELVNLGTRPEITTNQARALSTQAQDYDQLIAVGSGTVNDITKYAAHLAQKPYIAVATAASMNGYLSQNASLIEGTKKHSLAATAPIALIADMNIINSAPLKLLRAGIGDILCRSTIEADMILANLLTGQPYDASWFEPLRQQEEIIRECNGEMHSRDPALANAVMQSLILGGQLMNSHGSSAPCSQAEHMIVHTYDMLYNIPRTVLHGEAVSVATASMSKLQTKLLKRKPKIQPAHNPKASIQRAFGKTISEELWATYEKKLLSADDCERIAAQLDDAWPQLQDTIEQRCLKSSTLTILMGKFKCPTKYQDLVWSRDRYEGAVTKAHFTRDRFTFLDIAAMDRTLRFEL